MAITNADSADSYSGTILATASPITWGSGSSDKNVALALRNAINTAASTYLTASLDASGNSIILTGKGTDSTTLNYGVKVTVTDTTASNNSWAPLSSLPPTSFEFASSSLDGGSTGKSSASYALVYSYAVSEGGYTANGNLQGYSDTVMGDWAFQYDTLNRLTSAVPAPNAPSNYINTTGCWSYDAFGNRTTAAFATSTDCAGAGITSKFDTANRVTFVSQAAPISYSAPSGLVYDSAGNVYWDPNNTYAYDGEGRVCAVQQSALNGGGKFQYIYDASGNRIARASFTGALPAKNAACAAPGAAAGYHVTTQYLLNLAGEQVTELDGAGNWSHTNVWSGPHLSATYDTVNGGSLHFHLSDPLGTRRVQVDPSGRIEQTCQSLPFGDQLNCQTTSLVTADDATEHHFTGKERDGESGNDYFDARYYSSAMGRFMSPDWSAQEEPVPYAKLDNPQTLNLYSYVQNNPLTQIDPTGHDGDGPGVVTPTVPNTVGPTTEGYSEYLSGLADAGESALGDLAATWGGAIAMVFVSPQKLNDSPEDAHPELAAAANIAYLKAHPDVAAQLGVKLDNGRVIFPVGPTEEPAKPEPKPQAAAGGKGRIPKPPNTKEHTNGRQSTSDKHTQTRSGRDTTKDRVNPKWRSHKRSKKDQPAS